MLPLRGKTKMLPFQAGGALKKQSFVFYGRGGLYEGSRGEGAVKQKITGGPLLPPLACKGSIFCFYLCPQLFKKQKILFFLKDLLCRRGQGIKKQKCFLFKQEVAEEGQREVKIKYSFFWYAI
jgi:hypothetical protein